MTKSHQQKSEKISYASNYFNRKNVMKNTF
jgi:hypothetical protein